MYLFIHILLESNKLIGEFMKDQQNFSEIENQSKTELKNYIKDLRLKLVKAEKNLEEKISKGFSYTDNKNINLTNIHFQGYQDLMSHRVKDILLVSSMYDSFIVEQETQLSEQILKEYLELNLTYVPHLRQVSNCREALTMILEQKFDLILIMTKLDREDAVYFGKSVKELRPDTPVVALLQSESEFIRVYKNIDKTVIDKCFLWTGNSNILLGIIKFIEDRMNVDYDVKVGNVRVILCVEDSIKYYSMYLPIIDKEVMRQTRLLIDISLNNLERQLRMRVRPKILLAEDYAEFEELYEKYKTNIIGIISDVEYKKDGKLDPKAGFKLAEKVKSEFFDIPILLQSSDMSNSTEAYELNASFMHKRSNFVGDELTDFINNNLGFGAFIFRLPDGTVIDKAEDLTEMGNVLRSIPDEALHYHGQRNHFSNWLVARGEFKLAESLRIRRLSDFMSVEEIREYLIDVIKDYQKGKKEGIITEFNYWVKEGSDDKTDFIKVGEGSLGGKARGIAFVRYLLLRSNIKKSFPNININIPFTAVLTTDVFDIFMNHNRLHQIAYEGKSDYTIRDYFLRGFFPREVSDKFKTILNRVKTPIAVRSSSLLEDSQYQPFAGVYDTYIIPNNPNMPFDTRYRDLITAIKLVYASTYLQDAKNYMKSTSSRIQEEKMAVIIQEAVGNSYGKYFYPNISGVAQSYNFYPFRHIKPEDGLVTIALGFGRSVVEGESSFRFSPVYPDILPQFSTVTDILNNSQKYFYGLDLSEPVCQSITDTNSALVKLEIKDAEKHGTLKYIVSTYDPQNDRIYGGTFKKGYRVITFSQALKNEDFKIPEVIKRILDISEKSMGTPVEIEFAWNFKGKDEEKPELSLLQIRPMVVGREFDVDFDDLEKQNMIVSSTKAFGNGKVENIKDIIYVRKDTFDPAYTKEIAKELGKLNEKMTDMDIPYVLIGPGRWGSSDSWLGIPVKWSQISHANIIIETNLKDFLVDPSFGSHFFQNITSLGVYYYTIDIHKNEEFIKWDILDNMEAVYESKYIRHVQSKSMIEAFTDGKKGKGVLLLKSSDEFLN